MLRNDFVQEEDSERELDVICAISVRNPMRGRHCVYCTSTGSMSHLVREIFLHFVVHSTITQITLRNDVLISFRMDSDNRDDDRTTSLSVVLRIRARPRAMSNEQLLIDNVTYYWTLRIACLTRKYCTRYFEQLRKAMSRTSQSLSRLSGIRWIKSLHWERYRFFSVLC